MLDPRIKDLTGKRFGKLLVLQDSGLRNSAREVRWLCLCDCGDKVLRLSRSLRMAGKYKIGTKEYMKQWRTHNRENLREKNSAWRAQNKQKTKAHRAAHNYGISLQEYQEITSRKLCEICGKPPCSGDEILSIDHNHQTGKVRGALCRKCNSALGLANDNIEILKKMILYLGERK